MTYDEAVRYLLTLGAELAAPRQPARSGPAGVPVAKFDLRNISVLAERLGHPHRAYPCVHVAGTNGKGSTAAMLESILRAAGLRTGLYTSPHLERINERIRVNGAHISDSDFAEAFFRVQTIIEVLLASGTFPAHPTFFECVTAMAFHHFARSAAVPATGFAPEQDACEPPARRQRHGVDFAVFEVGMGGRLDSTNIVTPEVAVITQIDFDHENFLGHSIEQIAAEKAGIIKPGVPVVCAAERAEARAVIARRAAELNAPLTDVDEAYRIEQQDVGASFSSPELSAGQLKLAPTQAVTVTDQRANWRIMLTVPLAGRYQIRNAVTALAAARLLAARGFPVDDAAIARGIAAVEWPGRLELLQTNPTVYLDGTHNPAGARELLAFWEEYFPGRRIHLVYGALRDKPVDEIAGLLFPHAWRVILTAPRQARALSAAALAEMTGHHARNCEVVPEAAAALEQAIEGAAPGDVVFATGSLYLAGELRRWWNTARRAADARVVSRAL